MRVAFKMFVNEHSITDYIARHNPIWKELETALYQHGVIEYSIFVDPSHRELFGFAEIESKAEWDSIAQTDICKKWWAHMSDLMPTNADGSPVALELTEVFHIGGRRK